MPSDCPGPFDQKLEKWRVRGGKLCASAASLAGSGSLSKAESATSSDLPFICVRYELRILCRRLNVFVAAQLARRLRKFGFETFAFAITRRPNTVRPSRRRCREWPGTRRDDRSCATPSLTARSLCPQHLTARV
jgi:hypothetical protein